MLQVLPPNNISLWGACGALVYNKLQQEPFHDFLFSPIQNHTTEATMSVTVTDQSFHDALDDLAK